MSDQESTKEVNVCTTKAIARAAKLLLFLFHRLYRHVLELWPTILTRDADNFTTILLNSHLTIRFSYEKDRHANCCDSCTI